VDEPSLAGHVILVVEPAVNRFAGALQDALERRGAETLFVRGPGEARERLGAFRFSTCLIDYDHACDALHALIDDLGDMPMLLYGGASASIGAMRIVPRPAFARASVDSIVSALGRLPRPPRRRALVGRDDFISGS